MYIMIISQCVIDEKKSKSIAKIWMVVARLERGLTVVECAKEIVARKNRQWRSICIWETVSSSVEFCFAS